MNHSSFSFLIGLSLITLASCSGNHTPSYESSVETDTVVSPAEETTANELNLNTKTPEGRKFIRTADVKFKVKNVMSATEQIEDMAAGYGGFITYSDLENSVENRESTKISRDSILVTQLVVVENSMVLRVPNEKLDSLVRQFNKLITYLDYRIIKMDDVTLQFVANRMKSQRLNTYTKRQAGHVDNRGKKLGESTLAEDKILDRQMQADEVSVQTMSLEDQVNYCTINLAIYQEAIVVKSVKPNFEYVAASKPNIFSRIGDALIQGWWILEEIIVFFVKIWGVLLVVVGIVMLGLYLNKRLKNR